MKMPGLTGMDVLKGVKRMTTCTSVILLTACGTVNAAVKEMKEGTMDPFPSTFG
jgi:FixJ family two-component response regulator